MIRRFRFTVQGRVQGVGFRPFVFTMAQDLGLQGLVRNAPEGVLIEVQGPEPALEEFSRGLVAKLHPLDLIAPPGTKATGHLPRCSTF